MLLRTGCLAIVAIACAGEASPPRRVSAPAIPPVVEPPVVEPPVVEPRVEPPVVEPIAAQPPCPEAPRDKRQLPGEVVQLAELAPAMTVIDLGSGDGYFLCWFSRAVGDRGRVIATEVNKSLARALKKRVTLQELANVEVVKAPANDVGVAPGSADRIVLVNVWHHLPARNRYAKRIARALAPGGKVVVVDFKRRRRGGHGIAPETVLAELAAGGIDAAIVIEELPDQFVIIGTVRS
jgi:predicted methyltransferase